MWSVYELGCIVFVGDGMLWLLIDMLDGFVYFVYVWVDGCKFDDVLVLLEGIDVVDVVVDVKGCVLIVDNGLC